jgi:plastocyanin
MASSANGATSSTFDFQLNKALVIILFKAALMPPTLHVIAGQTVTWLNLADNTDENGYANVLLGNGSAPSPTFGLNDVWSHTFDKPGTYPYEVTVTLYPNHYGVVIVT